MNNKYNIEAQLYCRDKKLIKTIMEKFLNAEFFVKKIRDENSLITSFILSKEDASFDEIRWVIDNIDNQDDPLFDVEMRLIIGHFIYKYDIKNGFRVDHKTGILFNKELSITDFRSLLWFIENKGYYSDNHYK